MSSKKRLSFAPTNRGVLRVLVEHPTLKKDLRDNSGKSAYDYAKALKNRNYYEHVYAELNSEIEEQNCAICLEALNETAALAYKCPHKLHKACIKEYRKHQGRVCPQCRKPERKSG